MIPFPIAAMIVLTPLIVIGALVVFVSDRLRRRKPMSQPHGLLGKAYRPTFALIGVGAVVIAIAVWLL
jgi:hypothetical protein